MTEFGSKHALTHEDGGRDEIDATGLEGAPVAAHSSNHENDGPDEIDATGLEGVAGSALLGDGVVGRVIRRSILLVENGSTGNTIKCTLASKWNGDTIAATDNIPINGSNGHFSLDAAGNNLTVAAAGFSGNIITPLSVTIRNSTTTKHYYIAADHISSNLRLSLYSQDAGTYLVWDNEVDSGNVFIDILYLTDA